MVGQRQINGVARMARREVQRRGGTGEAEAPAVTPPVPASGDEGTLERRWQRLWELFDEPDAGERERALDAVRRQAIGLLPLLTAKFGAAEPLHRARALRIASRLGLVAELEVWVYRCGGDPDPTVRSLAVPMVAQFDSPAARQILERAVNDPEPRVQAAAIEALDRQDAPGRAALTEDKLYSENSRVRANAIKSLLRLRLPQAADALLSMLEDSPPGHRLSGLWVVERLRLNSLAERVERLASTDSDRRVRRRASRVLAVLRRGPTERSRRPALWKPHPAGLEEAGS
jgi:HEAT repeat protein